MGPETEFTFICAVGLEFNNMSLLPTYKKTQNRRFLTPGVFYSYFHKGFTVGSLKFFVILIVEESMLNSRELKIFVTLKDS